MLRQSQKAFQQRMQSCTAELLNCWIMNCWTASKEAGASSCTREGLPTQVRWQEMQGRVRGVGGRNEEVMGQEWVDWVCKSTTGPAGAYPREREQMIPFPEEAYRSQNSCRIQRHCVDAAVISSWRVRYDWAVAQVRWSHKLASQGCCGAKLLQWGPLRYACN